MKPVTRAAGSFHAMTALLLVLALQLPAARAADQSQRLVLDRSYGASRADQPAGVGEGLQDRAVVDCR
jgi:hypothetical protein